MVTDDPYSRGLQAALEALDEPATLLDAAGVVIASNEPWRALLRGGSVPDTGASYFDCFTGLTAAEAKAIGEVIAGTRDRAEVEHPIREPRRSLLIKARRLDDGRTLVTHNDITDRKRAEERLQTRETHLDVAQQLAAVGRFDLDLQTNSVTWSDELFRLYGYEPGCITPSLELVNSHVHPDDLPLLASVQERARRGADDIFYTLRIRRTDGALRMLEAAARVVKDESGRPLRFLGVVRDVTERHELAEHLRIAAARESAVADLGRLALRERSLRRLMTTAVELVRKTLAIDFCGVIELTQGNLRVIAGTGWRSVIFHRTFSREGLGDQAAFTLQTDAPVVSADLRSEARFKPSEYLLEAGVQSAMSLVIGGPSRPYGVIAVLSRSARVFAGDETVFMQNVANVIAEAVERKRAEDALAESERAFRDFFDQAPIAIYRTTVSGTILAANPAFARLLGYASVGEALPSDMSDFYVNPHERDEFVAEFMATGILQKTVQWRRQDGKFVWVALVWNVIRDENGTIIGWDGFAQDVTDRHLAEQRLRSSEERYRSIFEHTFDAVVTGDHSGNIFEVNEEFGRVFGYEGRSEPLHRSDIIDMNDESALRMLRTLETERQYRGDLRMRHADGTYFQAEASVARYFDRDGSPRSTAVFRDLTERIAAEERIRTQAAMLDSVLHPVVALTLDGKLFYWNRAAEQLFRLEGAQAQRITELGTVEETAAVAEAQERLARDEPWKGELAVRLRDGRSLPALVGIAPIFNNERLRIGMVVVAADMTEVKMLEAQLDQAHRVASLGHLAATVAHEFNNVLMAIQPFSEVVRLRAGGDERLLTAAHHIELGVRRGKHVAQEILRYAQQSTPVPQNVSLRQLLEEVLASWRTLEHERIDVSLILPHDDLPVHVDAMQIQQVFTNLIANARDAMPGGGKIRIAARHATGDGHYAFGIVNDVERFVHVEVRDTGTGIDTHVIKHIFDPLFTTKRTGGTGLGLAIVHRIIDSHGGAIFAESQPGFGTTFHLFLPAGGALSSATSRQQPLQRPTGRLLLIEDDALVAAAIGALLEDEGIAAEIVTQGLDAVPAIERSRPIAVVLDLNLPDVPGEEVYRRIAERWPDLPVVFSTGHADETKLAHYLQKPNVTYLLKPYELEALLAAVGKVVG